MDPKTPSKRSKNEKRTPLTPSLSHGLNNLSLTTNPTPTKSVKGNVKLSQRTRSLDVRKQYRDQDRDRDQPDTTNPFISQTQVPLKSTAFSKSLSSSSSSKGKSTGYDFRAALDLGGSRSRPASPVKKLSESGNFKVTEALRREASAGLLSKKDVQSQIDILTNDYTPPPRSKIPRSRSQPVITRSELSQSESERETTDRFITNRAEQNICATLEKMHLNHESASPGHTARLVEATGLPVNKRVLAFHEAPPMSNADPLLADQREHVKPLLGGSAGGLSTSSGGGSSSKLRKIPTQPERVLDAPGMIDDFYLNLISWSSLNVVAVALGESTYTWRADTGSVTHLGDVQEGTYVSCVDFSQDGTFLALGTGTGGVELWDVETGQKLRSMNGHEAQIASLSWNGHILSSGCADGSIWHHDVRIARHKVMELQGHHGEVCGLKWRSDGEYLASGGNDNVVNIWDARLPDSITDNGGETEIVSQAKVSKRNHTAAVKALAWCPWQPNLLASGGGTNDATIHIWNSNTGARLHSLKTPSQITSLHFAPHKKEILSTHGYPTNALMVHAYPGLTLVGEIREAHDARVLFSCVGPAGDLVLTGAGDENLKFWRVWEVPPKVGKRKEKGAGGRDGFMAIR